MISQIKNTTLFKYLASYFLIVVLMMTGFLLIAKTQFESTYNDNLLSAAKGHISSIQDTVEQELITLHEIHYYVENNENFRNYRYSNSNYSLIQLQKQLNEYITTNSLLLSVNYIDLSQDTFFSVGIPLLKRDAGYELYYQDTFIPFDLDSCLSSNNQHLFLLENNVTDLVIYTPKTKNPNLCILYVLDFSKLCKLMLPTPQSGITSICLLRSDNSFIAGYYPEILGEIKIDLSSNMDFYRIDSDTSIYATSAIADNCYIAAVISNKEIVDLVDHVMFKTYFLLIVLSIAAFLLIFLSMRFTYLPIHKLVLRVSDSTPAAHDYVKLLNSTFSELSSENRGLQTKLESYRVLIQKALLDSIISDHTGSVEEAINLDYLFGTNEVHYILFAKILNNGKNTYFMSLLQNHLERNLPKHEYARFSVIECDENSVVLLICYTNRKPKETELLAYFNQLHTSLGYRTALSNMADSPLEIPSLYSNMVIVSQMLSDTPVIAYTESILQSQDRNNYLYPFGQLEELHNQLKNLHFQQSKETVRQLFDILDHAVDQSEYFTEYFIRCILIDILTTIVNIINEMGVKFQNYEELYFSILYLCRSCSYQEAKNDIRSKIEEILNLYEELSSSTCITAKIQEIMMREYSSPDFSIIALADILHVSSDSYMSLLFKKNMGTSFTDYLWNIRLDKAKNMLTDTDTSIDEISVAVGYLNVASFRRKFKQSTGISPSQYRNSNHNV